MEVNWQEMLFQFLGGLGIFLFAIKYMGDGLQKAAGDRLRSILDRFTTNPFMGVLVGIIVTVLIQSSSGTTVITVGLVSAGFMTLRQAIGVIMGANIGTTITAFIIGLDVGEYALPIMAVGAILIFFFNKNTVKNMGEVIFGFGGLFLGLELMSGGMKPLRSLTAFSDLTVAMAIIQFLVSLQVLSLRLLYKVQVRQLGYCKVYMRKTLFLCKPLCRFCSEIISERQSQLFWLQSVHLLQQEEPQRHMYYLMLSVQLFL